jgi:hypothetical protein
MRKLLIIFGILLILAIVGVAGWLWWNSSQQPGPTGTSTPQGSETTPFGEGDGGEADGQPDGQSDTGNETGGTNQQTELALQQLTETAIAGAAAAHNATGTPVIRYLERQTGHVYELDPGTAERTRTSNTTVPGMHDTTWRRDTDALIARYATDEGEIRSFAARIMSPSATSTNSNIGNFERIAFLEQGISTLTPSPSKQQVFYLHPTDEGSTRGVIADFVADERQELFTTSFGSWRAQWPNERSVALTASASMYADGSLYFVDSTTGEMEYVFGGKQGLMTNVSPTLEHVLYATTSRSGVHGGIYNVASGTIDGLGFAPIPEKCEWSKQDPTLVYCAVPRSYEENTVYPDAWYQGTTHFTDMIWQIDVDESGSERVQVVADLPSRSREAIDAVSPFLGPNERHLYFTNKRDQTLWRVQLPGAPTS